MFVIVARVCEPLPFFFLACFVLCHHDFHHGIYRPSAIFLQPWTCGCYHVYKIMCLVLSEGEKEPSVCHPYSLKL